MLIFGPATFETEAEWSEVLDGIEPFTFLTLWYQSDEAGAHAAGEYAWPYDSGTGDHLTRLSNFYSVTRYSTTLDGT